MTNRDKYKQSFSALHPSKPIHLEEQNMKKARTSRILRPALALALGVSLIFGCAAAAYAADVGGIRTTLHLWLYGKQANVELTDKGDGSYDMVFDNGEETMAVSGGGVAFDFWGRERPLSPEEVAESFDSHVAYQEDGKLWLYYKSLALDLSPYMTSSGCKVVVDLDGEKMYFSIDPPDPEGGVGYSRSSKPLDGDNASDYTPINEKGVE